MELNDMELKPKETKEILDYEKEIGVRLIATGRFTNPAHRVSELYETSYTVSFNKAFVLTDGHYVSQYGKSGVLDDALATYCRSISGRRMIVDDSNGVRCFDNPILIHTKLFGK